MTSVRRKLGVLAVIFPISATAAGTVVQALPMSTQIVAPAVSPPSAPSRAAPLTPPGDDCIDLAATQWASTGRAAIQAEIQKRVDGFGVHVVLTVGNDYRNQTGTQIKSLANAANDAAWVAWHFKNLHYSALCLQNARYNDLIDAALALQRHHPEQGMVVFYFAGHGYSLGDSNWIVTSDLADGDISDIGDSSLRPAEILHIMAGDRAGLLLLDSCRNDLSGMLHAGTFHTSEAMAANAFADYAADAGSTALDWPENPDHHGLFVESFGDMFEDSVFMGRSTFLQLLQNINGTEGISGHPGQLNAANAFVAGYLSPIEDWSKVLEDAKSFLRTVSGAPQSVRVGPGGSTCLSAEILTAEILTVDDRVIPGGDEIIAARKDLMALRDHCRRLSANQSAAPIRSSTEVPSVPVILKSTSANFVSASAALTGDVAPATTGRSLKLQGTLALYNLFGSIATVQETPNSPAVQVSQPPSALATALPPILSLAGGEAVFASVSTAPSLLKTDTQVILDFPNQQGATPPNEVVQDISKLIDSAPSGNVSKYLIVFPPTGQGASSFTGSLRRHLIELEQIEITLNSNGVNLNQIVEPNLFSQPILPLSSMADSQVVLIRADPNTGAPATIRDLVGERRDITNRLKQLFSNLAKSIPSGTIGSH